MGKYVGDNGGWIDEIYTFEETDVVQGGPDGVDNVPIKGLADRTAWLKLQIGLMDRLSGEAVISANSAIDKTYSGKLISAVATGVLTLTLDNVATFKPGTIIPFSSFCAANSVVYIQSAAGQQFYDSGTGRSTMYMHDREHLLIMASTTGWKIVNAAGNFYCAGEETKSRKILRNTQAFIGQEIQRNLFPRLTEFVLSLSDGQVVSEGLWFSHPTMYKGFYTLGNGASTIRLPDERGMFERMLDLGRGVDISRYTNSAGGYEPDIVGSHEHDVPVKREHTSQDDVGVGRIATGNGPLEPSDGPILKALKNNTSENTVKNIGKYNLVRF